MLNNSAGRFPYLVALVIAVTIGGFVVPTKHVQAAAVTHRVTALQVGSSVARLSLFTGTFSGGASVAAADIDADGVDEYIVGAGPGGGPQVQVYQADGSLLSSFYAFDKKVTTGVNVAAGNINGDGSIQIVVGLLSGGSSEVRVFSSNGTFLRKFNAFESSYSGGVSVGVISGHDGSGGYIVVGSGFGREGEVRVYTASGGSVVTTFSPFGNAPSNGLSVAGGWSTTFGQNVVIVGAGQGERPLVQVWSVTTKQKLAQFFAYDQRVRTGVNVALRNEIILTGPSYGGGPDARMFSIRGDLISSQLVFENNFRGGIRVAGAVINGTVVPISVPTATPENTGGAGKKIVVSLSKQTLTMYLDGQVVSMRRVSTGKWSMPTPTGSFAVKNKIPVAYSRAYGLYMENWMAFTPDGRYGLHSLPYWKMKGGGKLYEGAAHIGTPVSHGCIRQTLAESKSLYDWVTIGTPVIVQA